MPTVGAEPFSRPSVFHRLGQGRYLREPVPYEPTPVRLPNSPANCLPAVTTQMREKLGKLDEFIDLTDLLRLPGQPTGATNLRIDRDNPNSVLVVPANKKSK